MNGTLLIATNSQLLVYDGEQKKVRDGYYWGITWDHERLYCVWGQHIWIVSPDFQAKDFIMGPLRDPHSLLWHDGVLYAANTGANRLDLWSKRQGFPPFINWTDHNKDIDHINGVWFHAGHFYAVEHRLALQPKCIRVFDESWKQVDVFEAEVETKGIHNVYNDGTHLVTLATNRILVWDLATKKYELLDPLADAGLTAELSYLRGLAVGNGRYYIGVTRLRTDIDSKKANAAILELDRHFRVLSVYLLKGIGAVKEIRLMEPLDLAHNKMPYPAELQ